MRILVVEDDVAVQEALSLVLQGEGHNVTAAVNGEVALHAVQANPPDLIIPVIAVSADASAQTQDLPVEVFLTKPMDIERLLAAVRENLNVT